MVGKDEEVQRCKVAFKVSIKKQARQKGVGKNLTPFLYVLRGTFYICPTTCIPFARLLDTSFLVFPYNAIANYVMHTPKKYAKLIDLA